MKLAYLYLWFTYLRDKKDCRLRAVPPSQLSLSSKKRETFSCLAPIFRSPMIFRFSLDGLSYERGTVRSLKKDSVLPGGESNPGLPRDKRGYSPQYFFLVFLALPRVECNALGSELQGGGISTGE